MAKQEEPLELKVGIKDFGPISRGEIALKPLTIFVGPNNSGKSYAAMLLHSIFEACFPATWLTNRLVRHMHARSLARPFLRVLEAGSVPSVAPLREGRVISIRPDDAKGLMLELLEGSLVAELDEEIKRSIGSNLRELVSIGSKSFELKIQTRQYMVKLRGAQRLRITKATVREGINVCIRSGTLKRPFGYWYRSRQRLEIFVPPQSLRSSKEDAALRGFVAGLLSTGLGEGMFRATARPCFYLPAARSGILLGYLPLASSIIGRAPLPGVGARETPGLSGVVADFLSILVSLPHERGKLYDLGCALEQEAMQGEVTLLPREGELPREIRYRYRGADIPLHRSSSTVSELAPLVLYLKYVVTPGSVLIIEEPEAHLHPANQRVLAKFLARLVRRGVHVVVTTHSDWLVEQLSSIIKLSTLDEHTREEKFPGLRDAVLAPSDVGVYVFSYDKRSRGHRIKAIEVDEDGIPEDEFLRIHEELYEENIAIERARERG